MHDFDESDPPRPRKKPRANRKVIAVARVSDPDHREIDDEELNKVIGWAVSGVTEFELRQKIAAGLPNVHPQEAIVAAMMRIARNADSDASIVMAWSFEAARSLFKEAATAKDYAEALKILKFINATAVQMAEYKAASDVREPKPEAK